MKTRPMLKHISLIIIILITLLAYRHMKLIASEWHEFTLTHCTEPEVCFTNTSHTCGDYAEYMVNTPLLEDTIVSRHIGPWSTFDEDYQVGNTFRFRSGSFDRLYTSRDTELDLRPYGHVRLEINVPKGTLVHAPQNTDEYRYSRDVCFKVLSRSMKTVMLDVNRPERTLALSNTVGLYDEATTKHLQPFTFDTIEIDLLPSC